MTPATLNTILNSAPMVIQGAGRLIRLIKEQTISKPGDITDTLPTLESLQAEIKALETRLTAADKSSIEQIKLMEQLARQNEALATAMRKNTGRLNLTMFIAGFASLVAIATLVLALSR